MEAQQGALVHDGERLVRPGVGQATDACADAARGLAARSAAFGEIRKLAGLLPAALSLRASGDWQTGGVGLRGVHMKNTNSTMMNCDMKRGAQIAPNEFARTAFSSRRPALSTLMDANRFAKK